MKMIEKIPNIGLGTWQLQGKECTEAVKESIKIGYNHIDTAEIYGNEEEIGEALADKKVKREDLWITSKVWWGNLSYENLLEACDESLSRLGTDYLDLYLIHWPNKNTDYDSTFKAFKKLKDKGKVRNIGVSNFTIPHLKEIVPIAKKNGIEIYCNQVEFHPLLYQKELLDYCKEKGIIVVGYSPLGHGKALENQIIENIAEKNKITPAQVCLRWALYKDVVVIPKSKDKERLEENFSLDFELDPQDIEAIDNISANKRFINPQIAEFDKNSSMA